VKLTVGRTFSLATTRSETAKGSGGDGYSHGVDHLEVV
jgi:hypothetical protein